MAVADSRSLPELVTSLVSDLADLVRKESELVRAEVSEKIAQAAHAGGKLAVGGALLLGGFLALLATIVLALSKAMDPVWATLIVAVVAGLVGFSLVKAAVRQVQPRALAPDRTTRQVQKDISLVKGQVQ